MSIIRDIFRKVSTHINDPFRVLEVNVEDYLTYDVVCREDCIVLYKINDRGILKLEIVVQLHINHSSNKNNKVYSLHRSEDETECQILFSQMCQKIPILIDCVPEVALSKVALQNVSQLIRENPTWNATHIAAHFGYTDSFKNKTIASQISEPCEGTLQTPLHVAIKALQFSSVVALVSLDVLMDIVDCNGDTVFHYAATTTKEIIQALSVRPCVPVINMLNHDGHTPLHLACMADKPECVKELLRAGADVNMACIVEEDDVDRAQMGEMPSKSLSDVMHTHAQRLYMDDMKTGGTPLHWSKTPELTEILIEYGCHIDARNFEGNTALHVMVLRNRISCAVTLLSHGANVDIQGADGNTPLHLAVKSGDIYLVYAFITFGANVNAINNKGETPRHIVATEKRPGFEEMIYALHIVGAERCQKRTGWCKDGCEPGKHFNGIPAENPPALNKTTLIDDLMGATTCALSPSQSKKCTCSFNSSGGDSMEIVPQNCRVLCLDGGGIRGLVLIQLLDQLEKVLGVPVNNCFDWIAGTSTGGVLALLLAQGKSVRECRCLYFRLKDRVFVGSRPYDAEPLEKILQKELGNETMMSDVKGARVMVTATKSDRHPAELHAFRNYDSPMEILTQEDLDPFHNTPLPKPSEQLVWQVARATGSAPTYFRAFGTFLDGGLISNNPTLDALTEIHQCNQAYRATHQEEKIREIDVVVSLGTGKSPVIAVETIDVFRPDSLWGACKMAFGVSAISQLLVDQATQTDGRVIARAQAMCSMLNIPYYRLNPQMTENVGLDTTDNNTLVKMLWETTAYMHSMRQELEQLCNILRR